MTREKTKISTKLVQLYRELGYQLKTGDIFYKVASNKGESKWGWKVGEFSHSCHVDTTTFIVLFFIDEKTNQRSVEYYSDFCLDSSIVL